jgi:hypothetical protein
MVRRMKSGRAGRIGREKAVEGVGVIPGVCIGLRRALTARRM